MIDKLIDSVAGIKEVCDLAVSLSLDMVELAYSIKEALHTAPASLESFIGEVHG